MIEIKKYSNRRLYNTETSAYITLDDIVTLIKKELDEGSLIQLSEHKLPVTKPYYLIYPKRTLDKPKAVEFIQWLHSLC